MDSSLFFESLQDEAPESPRITCEKHADTQVEYFCKDHNEAVCYSCKILGHKKCNYSDLNEEVDRMNKSRSFDDLSKQLEKLKTEYNTLRKQREKDKSDMNSQVDVCLSDIKQLRNVVNNVLDTLESDMTDNVNAIKNEMTSEMDDHCKTIDETVRQLEIQINLLEKCKQSFDNQAKFFGVTKVKREMPQFEQTKTDIESEIHTIEVKVQSDKLIENLKRQIKSFGKVIVNKTLRNAIQTSVSFMAFSLSNPEEYRIGPNTAHGCTFMPNGQLVMACGKDGVKLIDKDLIKYKSLLAIPAFDVAEVSNDEVIVTQGSKQQLQCITLGSILKAGRVIKTDRKCWHVDVDDDDIFVVCHDDPGNGEVRMLNMEGILQRRLGMYHGNCMTTLTHPSSVKVSKHTGTVFVSDSAANIVMCLDRQGTINYMYADAALKGPAGISIDDEDNILVCGKDSNNLHVIRKNGKQGKIFSMEKDKIESQQCVSFRKSDGRLVIGLCDSANEYVVFKIKTDNTQYAMTKYIYSLFGK